MPSSELVYSFSAPLHDSLAALCTAHELSAEDKRTLSEWTTPGDANEATLRALKRALNLQRGDGSCSSDCRLSAFLRANGAKPVLRRSLGPRATAAAGASGLTEAWRDELRARQHHREYQGLVSDLRKGEIEQVSEDRGRALSVMQTSAAAARN